MKEDVTEQIEQSRLALEGKIREALKEFTKNTGINVSQISPKYTFINVLKTPCLYIDLEISLAFGHQKQ